MSRSTVGYHTLVAGLVVIALVTALGNVATFRSQEGELAPPHRASAGNESDRLLTMTRAHGRNVGSRFTLYVWLGDRLPGSTVVLAPGHPLVEEGLVGLGRAELEVGDHAGELDAEVAEELADQAVERDWFSRGRFAVESSEQRFGEPAALDEGDHAVVVAGVSTEAEIADEDVRLLTYWSDELALLVDERVAAARGLPGAER